ncbi:MAG: hypothetical protein Fur007_24310 [Rhodoferax sp.]
MPLRILLVDDSPTFLASVKKFLAIQPQTQVVGEAYDGHQALQLAARVHPDLVLLDIVMPGPNGLDVARQLKTWAVAPHILFLSMHDNDSYRQAAKALGALGLVGKANFVADLLPILEALPNHTPEVHP